MSKRENLPPTSPTKESTSSNEEDDTYGFSDLKISSEVISLHELLQTASGSPHKISSEEDPLYLNDEQVLAACYSSHSVHTASSGVHPLLKSPQKESFSELSLPSTSRSILQSRLERPTTLKLSISSEENPLYLNDEQILAACYSPHSVQTGPPPFYYRSPPKESPSPQKLISGLPPLYGSHQRKTPSPRKVSSGYSPLHKSPQRDSLSPKTHAFESSASSSCRDLFQSRSLAGSTSLRLFSSEETSSYMSHGQVLAACCSPHSITIEPGTSAGSPKSTGKEWTSSKGTASSGYSPLLRSPQRDSLSPKIPSSGYSPLRRSPQRDSLSPKILPISLSSLNKSPQRGSQNVFESSASSPCRDLFPSRSLAGSASLRLFSSEETSSYIHGQVLAACCSPHSVTESGRSPGSPKTTGKDWTSIETDFPGNIVPDAFVKDERVYQVYGTTYSQFGGEASSIPSRYQWSPKGSCQASPDSPSKNRQWNPNVTEPSSGSFSTSGGIFRSYTIQKPWSPKRPGSSEIKQERVLESYSSIKQEVPSKSPQRSPKKLDSSGKVFANSPSPSGGTFRSYTIERPWSPTSPASPEIKLPEFTVKDDRIYQISSSGYSQIGIPSPGSRSPQATKNPWSIRHMASGIESPTSPSSRGILRKMKSSSRLSDSSETSSPEKQRLFSGRTFSPSQAACVFSPKASPETSRSSTPLYVKETTYLLQESPPKRVTFSAEPDEIADIEVDDKKDEVF